MSRPHAEELKEPLCCDRGRAARPSELGKEALFGGGCRPVREREEETGKKDRDGMEKTAREKRGPRERS